MPQQGAVCNNGPRRLLRDWDLVQARRTLHCVEGLAAAYSAALAAAAAGGETAAEPPAQRAAAPLVAEAEEPTAPSTIKGKEGLEDWDASISKDSVQVLSSCNMAWSEVIRAVVSTELAPLLSNFGFIGLRRMTGSTQQRVSCQRRAQQRG